MDVGCLSGRLVYWLFVCLVGMLTSCAKMVLLKIEVSVKNAPLYSQLHSSSMVALFSMNMKMKTSRRKTKKSVSLLPSHPYFRKKIHKTIFACWMFYGFLFFRLDICWMCTFYSPHSKAFIWIGNLQFFLFFTIFTFL